MPTSEMPLQPSWSQCVSTQGPQTCQAWGSRSDPDAEPSLGTLPWDLSHGVPGKRKCLCVTFTLCCCHTVNSVHLLSASEGPPVTCSQASQSLGREHRGIRMGGVCRRPASAHRPYGSMSTTAFTVQCTRATCKHKRGSIIEQVTDTWTSVTLFLLSPQKNSDYLTRQTQRP